MDEEKLKKNMNFSYTCTDCQNNLAVCFQCKGKGYFFPELQGKNKSKKFEFPPASDAADKNEMDEEKPKDDDASEGEIKEEDTDAEKVKEETFEEEEQEGEGNKDKMQIENGPKMARTMENLLTKCSTANCNKFYHLECIKSNTLFKYFDSNKHKKFRCSLHYCARCGISGDTMAIAQCIRCPKSYHLKCYPKDKITKLTKKLIICQVYFLIITLCSNYILGS